MTLSDITTKVRRSLSDDSYDATLIMDAANYFIYSLFANTRTRLMETSSTLDGSAGDTEVALPDDINVWTSIYVTSPQVYDIKDHYAEYGNFMLDHADFATASARAARTWTDFGNQMRFAGPLLTDTTFQIDYVRTPKPMTAQGSKCELPDQYIELAVRGTKARVLEIDENYDYAGVESDELGPLVTTFIRNEARGGGKTGPTIMRTKRRHVRL